jgi:DNA-binding CsgD family transcriptional regulator
MRSASCSRNWCRICGASCIYRRFALLDLDRIAALEELDQFAVGVVVARKDGMLVCANRAAEDLLRSTKSLAVEDGRLQAQTVAGDEQIRRALSLVSRPAQAGPHPVKISDLDSAGELQMLVTKLPGRREPKSLALPPRDLVALVFETDTRRHLKQWEGLQHAFGLLISEARLVELLANGASLAEAARQLGLKTGSARQYLKRVFRKTGVNRQADLVRKVLSSPVWMQYPTEP